MSTKSYEKDPNSVLDYAFDWTQWLADSEIITSIDTLSTGSIVIEDETSFTDSVVTVWVSGGQQGEYTTVTARITTNQGRTEDRTIRLIIKER